MTPDAVTIFILIISGFGSGVFVGMGAGATGSIMITALTVVLGQSVHKSIGTTLLINCVIGGTAGLIFLKHGNVNVKPALFLASAGMVGSFLGSQLTASAPESSLLLIISLILIVLGISFIVKGVQYNVDLIASTVNIQRFQQHALPFLVLFGFIAGVVSGFSGMGVGGVVALILILLLGYEIHVAVGTSLIMIFFISGVATISHAINNEMIYSAGLVAGTSAIVGALLGSLAANKIDEDKLGRVVGVFILIMGLIIFLRSLQYFGVF